VVKRSDRQEPISEVLISLTPDPGLRTLTTLIGWTDNEGRFRIDNIPEGTYRVSVHRDGFFGPVTEPSAEIPPESSITLSVRAQELKPPINFWLTPGGAISGRITAPTGRPAFRARVHAIPINGPGDKTTVSTNDRGEYRFFWLKPGQYVISSVPPWESFEDTPAENYSVTYYPGTADASAAIPIELKGGADIRGVDFSYKSAFTVTVKGKITSAVPLRSGGGPLANVPSLFNLYLFPHESPAPESQVRSPKSASVRNEARLPGDGLFEIRNVAPGTYDLGVELNGIEAKRYTALVPITVGFATLENVTVNIQQPSSINGTVIAADPSMQNGLAGVRVEVQRSSTQSAEMAGFLLWPGGFTDASGRFTIRDIPSGGYRLTMTSSSAVIVDVRQNGKSILNNGLTITEGPPSPVEVIVGRAR
jgi:hypothetical protein